jgi:hypothetical protein
MNRQRRDRLARSLMLVAVALAGVLLAGCAERSSTSGAGVKGGPTALGSLKIAESALSTTAPDAKLLVVQTAQPVTATSTPVWGYIFGSPKTGDAYMVNVANNASMGAQDLGPTGLSASEWPKVPGTDQWKIDSDAAYAKALAASGAHGAPAAYIMGFETYKTAADTSTIEPFVWLVQFKPGASGATTSPVNVDARTGAVSVSK